MSSNKQRVSCGRVASKSDSNLSFLSLVSCSKISVFDRGLWEFLRDHLEPSPAEGANSLHICFGTVVQCKNDLPLRMRTESLGIETFFFKKPPDTTTHSEKLRASAIDFERDRSGRVDIDAKT